MAFGARSWPIPLGRLRRWARKTRFAGHHPPTLGWRLMRLLVASSKDHAFLDRAWISRLFRFTPRRLRRPLALRLLSLSPHYWVYQWTNYYPAGLPRGEILRREYERNSASRKELCDKLLARFLRPQMTVLDFGCGPGFLARWVSPLVAQVIATDVSRGVLACARQINPADNLRYVRNGLSDLAEVGNCSVDFVYSFAVFQHLLKGQSLAFLREFARVLKPGGTGAIHSILKEPEAAPRYPDAGSTGWIARRVNLRMVYFTAAEMAALLAQAGLADVQVVRVDTLAAINDDIGQEHLVTFRRPAADHP
jgi:2-polyprenyl-3-methyl-5-hydroxy-6-metoxy-1,4-benzoquinol methylase